MRKSLVFVMAFLLVAAIWSCSKDKDGNGGPNPGGGKYPQSLQGMIYYDWATQGILKISMPDGNGGAFIQDKTKLNNFDVSRDGKLKLTVHNASTLGNDRAKFVLSNIENNTIIQEFEYTSPARNGYVDGFLSPDNSLIVVQSNDTDKDGVTVLKVNGEFVLRMDGIGGVPFSMNDIQLWLPGNVMILTHNNNIYRVAPPYTSAALIKTMDYSDWSALTVNHQGTQMAMKIGNHIHVMNIDGTNMKQVTTSNFVESKPIFSPDGTYLLVGSHYRMTGPFGYSFDLKLIPNDGTQYNVDPVAQNSAGVIPVVWNGKDKIESGGGQVVWR